MLNSIGLENRGADRFLAETLPRMKTLGPKVVVNIGGEAIDEFVELAARFAAAGVDALEINLSCPNVQGGRLLFSSDPGMAERAVRAVRDEVDVPLFAKLSPNVTRIGDIALAVEAGGADGITAINTLIGMAVDWRRRAPRIGSTIAGLSGPAIKPVALRMVHEIRKAVRLPILGVGGIASAEDALEFLVTGAAAVQVGTWNFVDPAAMPRLLDDLERLLAEERTTVRELIGTLQTRGPVVAPEPPAAARAAAPRGGAG
jgi:dihydroorotate dehydrogenase (NAD+) catalytic subunit